MKQACRLASAALLLCAAPTTSIAIAQIGADHCAAADAITGTGSFAFDTANPSDTGVPATTSFEHQQCVDLTADVWIQWTAPAGLDGHIVRFDTCGATFDTEIAIWQGTCASMAALGCNDFSTVCSNEGSGSAFEITAIGGEIYQVQVGFYSFAGYVWGSGNLTVTDLGPDPCLSTPPDAFEPNDDCGSAAPLAAGDYPGLFVGRTDPDFFRTTVPAGHRYTAVATAPSLGFSNDFRLFLTDDDCDTQLSVSAPNIVQRTVVATNRTAAPIEVVLEARLASHINFPLCALYDLTVTVAPETCLESVDDGLEGNDACDDAVPISNGFYSALHVERFDVDYYRLRLDGQTLLEIDALFQEELGDIDMTLWEWFWCGTVNSVYSAAGSSDNERISYFNQDNETREFILAVYMKHNGGDFACYDLAVSGAVDMPASNYCTAATNSIGEEVQIEVLGSPTVADEDVFLRATGLPQGVPGLFYFGPNQIQTTFGDGFRCVGGMTTRIMPAALAMGPAPSITQRELNFDAPYAAAINAGANLNFQLWYRDPMAGMSGFNLSDGTGVAFQ